MSDSTSASAVLEPPSSELTLTPPAPVTAVAEEKAGGMVPLDPKAVPGLDKMVSDYVANLGGLDVHAPDFAAKTNSIRTMGDADIRAAASVSNTLLAAPMKAMEKGGLSSTSTVSKGLVELRRTLEDLDPSHTAQLKHKVLGFIPVAGKLRDYFARYESAQTQLNAILQSLYNGQDQLRKDNAALEQEKAHLWETMQHLAQYIYVAAHLDATLEARIAEIQATDPDTAKVWREDVLFYVRQKHQDLLTQLAVSIQGYLATDLVRKNNLELIKGVDRATTTTVSALRTAVIVAQALNNQQLVLNQIAALNTTTSNLIESTSAMLASQSVKINEQAAGSTIDLDKLQAAFTNIYQTMDAIDSYKLQALESMKTTVSALDTEVQKAQSYLTRVQQPGTSSQGGPPRPPSS